LGPIRLVEMIFICLDVWSLEFTGIWCIGIYIITNKT
jgi:hypothetical protein